MSNPLFNSMNQRQTAGPGTGGMNNNPFQMFMNKFNDFKKFASGMNPADAENKVKEMLSNGQMSQEQFEKLAAMAEQFQGMLGGRRQ